jgi:hypothetical protein
MRKATPTLDEAQRRYALRAMKALPGSKVYYDAKVIGIELPDGTYKSLRVGRLGLPIRTWDNLIVYRLDGSDEIVRAEPVALKPSMVAQLRPKSTMHRQTAGVDAGLHAREGRLIVVVTDPLDRAVSSLRINPRAVAQTRYTACEELTDAAISGTWRAFSETGTGLVIEAYPGMEFTILQRPRGVDIAGLTAAGPVRVSDAEYAADTHTLAFSYHTRDPFGGELSSHVRLVGTEPGLFEGDEIGSWIGATARRFLLRWHRF